MNSEHIITYIQNPLLIDPLVTKEIEQVLEQFPYFQTAHLLYIRGLKNNKSISYNNQLKIAATYAGNRTKLFELLHQLDIEEISSQILAQKTVVEIETSQEEIQIEVQDIIEDSVTSEVEPVIVETVIENSSENIEVSINESHQDNSTTIVEETIIENSTKTLETIIEHTREEVKIVVEPEFISIDDSYIEENTENDYSEVNVTIIEEELNSEQIVGNVQEEIIEQIEIVPIQPIIEDTIVAPEITPEEIPAETIAQTIEEVQQKPTQSLADIILQRIKEIKERDELIAKEKTQETVSTTLQEPTKPELIEVSEPLKIIEETQPIIQEIAIEEKQEIVVEPVLEDTIESFTTEEPVELELLEFAFEVEKVEEQVITESPKKEDSLDSLRKEYGISDVWFPDTEISFQNFDHSNLIDSFLAKQQNIKPDFTKEVENQQDISSESVKEGEYLSETLAKIYMQQNNFDKALHIYKKLSLKYPQKSIYFANQISELEKKLK